MAGRPRGLIWDQPTRKQGRRGAVPIRPLCPLLLRLTECLLALQTSPLTPSSPRSGLPPSQEADSESGPWGKLEFP